MSGQDYEYDHEVEYRDPYEDTEKVQLREKWIEETKILHGDFVQSGRNKALSKINSANAPDIMRNFAAEIDRDWEDAEFQIYRDDEVGWSFSCVFL